jgi:hypothetical protein
MAARLGDVDEASLSRLAAITEAAGASSAPLLAATAATAATAAANGAAGAKGGTGLRVVVLVEGMSDRSALITLAARRGRDLEREGVFVVPMGGATNIGHFLDLFGPAGLGARLAGLCDQGEEDGFRRSVERAGLRWTGFFVCVADLEDEMIRALGAPAVEEVIEAAGERGPFRTFTRQPFQRDRSRAQQLRRFMGTRSGRKVRYGQLLASALDLTRVPDPLDALLAAI